MNDAARRIIHNPGVSLSSPVTLLPGITAPRRLALALALTAVALCLGHAGPASAIMAGVEPDAPDRRIDPNFSISTWASVGSVVVNGRPYSGVLVTRRHVLTAAHVAGSDPAALAFVLNFGGNATHRLAVAGIHRHPDWAGFDPKKPNDDLAVLVLAEPAPPDVPVYPIGVGAVPSGVRFTAVGYGASGQGDQGASVPASESVKRVGENTADAFVADDEGGREIEAFVFDFDGPGAPNALGGPGLGNDVETSFAGGDSGSPSFVRTARGWVLFGINTFIFAFPQGPTTLSTFGTGGGGVILGAYRDWILGVVRDTGGQARGGAGLPRFVALADAMRDGPPHPPGDERPLRGKSTRPAHVHARAIRLQRSMGTVDSDTVHAGPRT